LNKPWQPYAQHILDAIERIRRIEVRGDLTQDEILYDATLRNLQTLSEATRLLLDDLKLACPNGHGAKSAVFATSLSTIILDESRCLKRLATKDVYRRTQTSETTR
jgi:hypothetical protein